MAPSLDIMALAAVETLRISLPTIIEAARGTVSPDVCDERLLSWSRRLLDDAGIQLQVKGREHIAPNEGYIVMSNHQSHYDIPVLYQALRIPLRMVAKKEIFRVPFMAGAMRAAGFVELDRRNGHSALEALTSVHKRLPGTMSLWIAPEGTRSKTGIMGPFKRGGFHVALLNGKRVLPVSIDGTRRALPAGLLKVSRGITARVTIGQPIDPANFDADRVNQLIAAVREEIANHLPSYSENSNSHASGEQG